MIDDEKSSLTVLAALSGAQANFCSNFPRFSAFCVDFLHFSEIYARAGEERGSG
jgi:hypothetical protein